MGTGSGLTTRVKTKRRLSVVKGYLRNANLVLCEIHQLYKLPSPVIGEACKRCVEVISIVETMVSDIRDQL